MKHFYLLLLTVFVIQTTQAQIVNIPDANFKNALLNTNSGSPTGSSNDFADVDTNDDGEIQVSEAEAIVSLTVDNQNISSLEGIEAFVNLIEFNANNNQLTSLNISTLNELVNLYLGNNLFTTTDTIIFPTNSNSYGLALFIESNQLTEINPNNLPSYLSDLSCSNNQLTSLDLSAFDIYEFYCSNNPNLTSLQLSSYIGDLSLNNIGIAELDVSGLSNLYTLGCSNNPNLVSVKIGQGSEYGFYIQNNPVLETISFKNGVNNLSGAGPGDSQNYYICNNPNLAFVCADENEIEDSSITVNEGGDIFEVPIYGIQHLVNSCGYANVIVSSYCEDYVAGGTFYEVNGVGRLDSNANGCDTTDDPVANLKLNITQGFNAGDFTADALGNYTYLVQEGTHTITPELENPTYFTVSPTSYTVNFPTDTSPFTQDFCITPSGTFNDLEVTILPLELARPGFDTDYKIIYKNKGSTTLTGNVGLMFQDDVMDLVVSTPVADNQTVNNLSFNYSNLVPFETREILFTMNINAPTETPPVNGDDLLVFTANIIPTSGDETPDDNTFTLNQTVVNSYDPNDKTCLEGTTIEPDMIGKYVNYVIRFENTGTANAINVVVKDEIDTNKFDISTLIVTNTSHSARTSITNSDEVRFSFENINLPFDDANNDGYIAFKIKTLNTLVEGDTFENDAEIYFDYNFPIITNNYVTTIVNTLSTDTFEYNDIRVYPNPVQNLLKIEGKDNIKSVFIYDISGRLISQTSYLGNHKSIEISTEQLTPGTYFVKVKTDVGERIKKILKE